MNQNPLRSRSVVAILVVVIAAIVGLSGCAEEDGPPPTRDEVLFACGTFNLEACRTFGRCLGWDQARVATCVNDENRKCGGDLAAESCWSAQQDALERCAADVAAESCASACGDDGFCFAGCSYYCPSGE